MAQMNIDLPKKLNKMLRRFAIDKELGSREKSTIYILWNFLDEFYNVKKEVEASG